jgi:pSer/pThr/pTyr-binding forkhead associated (FHA) protein
MKDWPQGFNDLSTMRGLEDGVEADSPFTGALLEIQCCPLGQGTGKQTVLGPGESLAIGRDVDLGLRLTDLRASRLHCRIVWDSHHRVHRCGDAHSANGTFVNGKRIESVPLRSNDVIRVGDTLFVYSLEAEPFSADRVARGLSTLALPILIQGETGSGKEVLARAIHARSGRSGPFVAVNCAALPPAIAAAELFGHTRGAFSGAGAARAGILRSACGGTLLLDEVAECALELQASLLRVLQEGQVRPLGSDHEVSVDLRIISATHVDLERAIEQGTFREDLYGRLAQSVVRVPPLRERRRELLPLLKEFAPNLELSAGAAEAVLLWGFPRNVRELKALAESLRHRRRAGGTVQVADLLDRIPTAAVVKERKEAPAQSELEPAGNGTRERLAQLLRTHAGNVSEVARAMNKPRSQIYRWMRVFDLAKERA